MAEIPQEAVEAFERVFYAEHPQDAIRPLTGALEAASHFLVAQEQEALEKAERNLEQARSWNDYYRKKAETAEADHAATIETLRRRDDQLAVSEMRVEALEAAINHARWNALNGANEDSPILVDREDWNRLRRLASSPVSVEPGGERNET